MRASRVALSTTAWGDATGKVAICASRPVICWVSASRLLVRVCFTSGDRGATFPAVAAVAVAGV